MSARKSDQVFTQWAREWWPEVEIFSTMNADEVEEFFIVKGPRRGETLGLGVGRLDARLGLHVLINSCLHRKEIGPDGITT